MKQTNPSSNPFVIGTSGQIDHGKTTLVKALTGVDTDRFIDEKIGEHWAVDETPESFSRLMQHIATTPRFKPHFERALSDWRLYSKSEGVVVADIGAGVGWTSAFLCNLPTVKKIYIIEPSLERFNKIEHVLRHFNCDFNKIKLIRNDFKNFTLPEKIDIFILSASLHHCLNSEMENLFNNIKKNLSENSYFQYNNYLGKNVKVKFVPKVVIINEHFINKIVFLKRYLFYFLSLLRLKKPKYDWNNNKVGPGNWNAYNFHDNEHHRTKDEVTNIFKDHGFDYKIHVHNDSLLDKSIYKNKINFLKPLYYYYAILTLKKK